MEREHLTIAIEGEEVTDLYPDLQSVEVELDDELASMFRIQIPLAKQADGSWKYLDDERLTAWKKVTIKGGFETGMEDLMTGYITHVRPSFPSDCTEVVMEIWGMDGSVLMDRQEKLKDWPNKKDSDIAAEIFSQYGFIPLVQDTAVIHDEAVSTIIQRETDMQFLKRLALRNGFQCFVEGQTGYFQAVNVEEEPQPVLAAHFGDKTNLVKFSIELNALKPANVTMFQVDRASKEVLDASAEVSALIPLGRMNSAALLASGINPGQVFIAMNAATGTPEMSVLCRGLFQEGDWFVTGEGEISANDYKHVLKPRKSVTIKGVGETYSGVYYVNHVTHSFACDGYTQSFCVKRNAVKPTGSENFPASSD